MDGLATANETMVTIPGDGDFAGQTALISLNANDSSLTITVAGGLWLVGALWTWKGLSNPLGGMRNFIIAWTWGLICVFLASWFRPFGRCGQCRPKE